MKKRILTAILLLLCALLIFCGCDKGKDPDPDEQPKEATLSICYPEDSSHKGEYEEYVADDSFPMEVIISTDEPVTFLTVLGLMYEEYEDEYTFAATELNGYKYFNPERPLKLTVTDYGEIPSYGISYIDSCGEKHAFAICVSGYDGSVYLEEIEISMG